MGPLSSGNLTTILSSEYVNSSRLIFYSSFATGKLQKKE
jgi:hypothetical protein